MSLSTFLQVLIGCSYGPYSPLSFHADVIAKMAGQSSDVEGSCTSYHLAGCPLLSIPELSVHAKLCVGKHSRGSLAWNGTAAPAGSTITPPSHRLAQRTAYATGIAQQ